MRIEIFVDDATDPFQVIEPPDRIKLDTTTLSDGQHVLRFRAIDDGDDVGERVVPFLVQNGPEIAIHGLAPGDTVSGEVALLANAYSSRIGDEFEPMRIETPAPIPTWAWVLCLAVLAWGAGYLSLDFHNRVDVPYTAAALPLGEDDGQVDTGESSEVALGEQVYGNNCASCHQGNGSGLAGVFPPLKNNPAVLAEDPTDHVNAILHGLSGKVIDGISYPAPMPPFGTILSDAEVAAVVNHERRLWGSGAPQITEAEVAALR